MAKTSVLKFASISLLLFSAVLVADIFNPVGKVSAQGGLIGTLVTGPLQCKQKTGYFLFTFDKLILFCFVLHSL